MRYRKNLVSVLEYDWGTTFSDHQHKENLIWISFRDRLGVSGFTGIHFNLDQLLDNTADLWSLCRPFTVHEIDQVVKSLPSDKAPGPDGFNTDFVKNVGPLLIWIFIIFAMLFMMGTFVYRVSMVP